MTKAVVMISLGVRPWLAHTLTGAKAYAQRCGADFFLEDTEPSHEEFPLPYLPDSPGRPNKIAYAMKCYVPWKYLSQGYERVLVVDDTCCFNPGAKSLFDIVPSGTTGIRPTNKEHAERSYKFIRKKARKHAEIDAVEFDLDYYLKSSVVLYDKSAMPALAPDQVIPAAPLLFASHPHQTLLFFLFLKWRPPVSQYPGHFNKIPGFALSKQERFAIANIKPYLSSKISIYHITGGYRHREALIGQICDFFEALA